MKAINYHGFNIFSSDFRTFHVVCVRKEEISLYLSIYAKSFVQLKYHDIYNLFKFIDIESKKNSQIALKNYTRNFPFPYNSYNFE